MKRSTWVLTKRPILTGMIALAALAFFQWILIALASVGAFTLWTVASPLLAVALFSGLLTFGAMPRHDRGALIGLVLLALVLYLPPAEELALTGDAAIYVNEGLFVARTGGLQSTHDALAALPTETRTLFYVTATEQFPVRPMQSYEGIVYRGYYMADAATATIETSRMPLSTVWFAWLSLLGGVQRALYSTPLFALLSLLVFYGVARRFFGWPVALVVTTLLAVSYPQIYFGRLSYAEIFGQFWTLAGIITALLWIERRTAPFLVLALFCWVTAWAGRIDALLLLPATYLLLIYAALARDRRTLIAVGLALPLLAALAYLGTNVAYAGATFEIQQWRWPWFGNALLALLLLGPLSTLIAWHWGRSVQRWLLRIRPALQLLALGAFALIILWATIPNPLRDATHTRYYQEIIWYSSAYLTPLFYWLALIGVGQLLIGGYDARQLWLLALLYSLAAIFFYTYTSGRVYPVSLRRLTSDLLPLMTLMVGFALNGAPTETNASHRRRWQSIRWGIAIVVFLWMGWLSRPLLPVHEGVNTTAYLEKLHQSVPADAVLIFEDQDGDSWVGWLAAPLYSHYGDWTLLLDGDTPDPALWQSAIDTLAATGRPIYVVTQQPEYPAPLQLPGYSATLEQELPWQSTLIGQTYNPPYPPPIWDFVHPLRLYRLGAADGSVAAPPLATLPIVDEATPIVTKSPDGELATTLFIPTAADSSDRADRSSSLLYYPNCHL